MSRKNDKKLGFEYKIISPDDDYEEMLRELELGKARGTTTYIPAYDQHWTWKDKTVNILTGYSNEGKGMWIKQLALIKALEERKKFIIYAPEDYPSKDYFDDLIHTLTGKTSDPTFDNHITKKEYIAAFKIIKDLFKLIYIKPPKNNISNIIEIASRLANSDPDMYGMILDPHSQIERDKHAPERDDLYGSYFMSILKDFALSHDIISFLVMHQQTPKKDQTKGTYPEPDGYQVKQGGNYMNSADSVHIAWRPEFGKDKTSTTTIVGTKKVKMQKLVGIPGTITIDFDRKTNRYVKLSPDYTGISSPVKIPIYDWDKWLKK